MTLAAADARSAHKEANPRSEAISPKAIPTSERLIAALDVPDVEKAKRLVEELGDSVAFYKLGLELFMTGNLYPLLDWLHDRGKKSFVDLKFFDVPNTVGSAVRQLSGRNAAFATVHGNDDILRAAAAEKNDLKILAVTVLTSLDNHDLQALGFAVDVRRLVLSRARRALEIGCDGVISSGLEAAELRQNLGNNFLIVVPGIRPVENRDTDDQKRTVDVEEAFERGADYIVVGRPIRGAASPRAVAESMQERIARLFA
jgi:orotidine-5'-phosphate decarboxylase